MAFVAELKNVSVSIQDRLVLDDISISFNENQFSVIFGPNGAGKTTLLKLLIGQIKPDTGTIKLCGGPVLQNLSNVGYVPQDFFSKKQFPISVLKTVVTGRYARIGWGKRVSEKDYSIARETIKLVGLSNYEDRYLSELSGGELQRVFLARALCGEPKVLLLDEASSGVDVGAKETLYDLLYRLKERLAIIFVSHDMSVVSKGVDMVCCLDRKLVSHGSPEVALTDEALICMYGHNVATFSHCNTPHVHVHDHSHSHTHDHIQNDKDKS